MRRAQAVAHLASTARTATSRGAMPDGGGVGAEMVFGEMLTVSNVDVQLHAP